MAKKKDKKKEKAPADENAPPKKGIKGLIGGILTPIIMGGSAFAAVYLLPNPGQDTDHSAADAAHAAPVLDVESYQKPAIETDIIALNQMTLSINENQSILRINIALETPSVNGSEIDPSDPRLRDAFVGYLRAVDIAQLEEASFMPQLRQQLLRRSRLVLGHDQVSAVLITDFLIR